MSPAGDVLAATTLSPTDSSLWIFELASGERRRMQGASKPSVLAFTPDGSRVVSGNVGDGTVSLWHVERGHTLSLTGLNGEIQSVAVSPDGRRIVAADGSGAHRVWDAGPSPGK